MIFALPRQAKLAQGGWLAVVAAVTMLACGANGARAQNLFADWQSWRPTGRPVDSTVGEYEPGGLLWHGGRRPAEHAYGKPLELPGARLRMAWQFLQDVEGRSRVEFVFHGVRTAAGQNLRIGAAWRKSELSMAGRSREVFLSAELQGRFAWEIVFGESLATLYWQGQEVAQEAVSYVGDRQSIGVVVTDADVAFTELAVGRVAPSRAQIWSAEDALDVKLDLTGEALQRMPSAWMDYFGVHCGLRYYHGLIEALTNYPDMIGRYYNTLRSCTNYGDFQAQLALEKDRPVHRGPFGDGETRVDLSDLGNEFEGRFYPLEETLPELLGRGTDMVFDTWKFVRPSAEPLDQNLLYWTMRSLYDRFPEANPQIVWQMGNEIQGPQFDYLGAKKGEATPSKRPEDREGNLRERQDFYVNEFLAPSVDVVERIGRDVYQDERAIKVLLGSTVGHTDWLFEILERPFASAVAPSLNGDKVWQHIDIVCPHYTLGSKAGLADLQEIYDEYLRPGKIKGIWITESYGWAGAGPVTVIQQGFDFLGWAARNALTADQTRVIWWGLDVAKAGGSGLEFWDRLGAFMAGQPFYFDAQTTPIGEVSIVANGEGPELSRFFAVIRPTITDGAVAVGDVVIDLPASAAARNWRVEGVQYSTLAFPETTEVGLQRAGNQLQLRLRRRLAEPFVLYLVADDT